MQCLKITQLLACDPGGQSYEAKMKVLVGLHSLGTLLGENPVPAFSSFQGLLTFFELWPFTVFLVHIPATSASALGPS